MKLTEIKLDGDLQSRAQISDEVVDDYSETLREGGKLPAVVVFHDGASYHLADGWHRYFAHKKAGLATIDAVIKEGTRREAIMYSVGANAEHGLRRTNEDKRKAIQTLLDDMEWNEWSDREISRACKVSNGLVSRMRKATGIEKEEVKVKRGDSEFTMKTDNLKVPAAPKKEIEYEFQTPDDRLVEMATTIEELAQDLEKANQRIAVAAYEGTDEEKGLVEEKLAQMQNQITSLELENKHLKARNMALLNQENEYKKQIKLYEKQVYAMRKQLETA
jgi:hypothetical protein